MVGIAPTAIVRRHQFRHMVSFDDYPSGLHDAFLIAQKISGDHLIKDQGSPKGDSAERDPSVPNGAALATLVGAYR